MNREQVRIKLIEWIAELVTEWQSRTSESDRSDLINGLTDKILALDQPQEEIEEIDVVFRDPISGDWEHNEYKLAVKINEIIRVINKLNK